MFFLDQKHNLAVAQIPKCGINTIREWLGKSAAVVENHDPELMKVTRRVAFIRHPVERLVSAYSFFFWLEDDGRRHSCKAPVDTWESFVDYVLSDIPDDEHWLAQTKHVGDIPNIYTRFEGLANKFELYRPGILPHHNRTTHRPVSDYKGKELEIKYSKDLSLWNRIN